MTISNTGKFSLIALALLTSMFLLSGLAPVQNEENAEVSRLLSDASSAKARVNGIAVRSGNSILPVFYVDGRG